MATVPLSEIIVGKRHRETFGDIKALATSIASIGLLHPIVITPEKRLIVGQRRLLAAQQLGWRDIPATIVKTFDDLMQALKAECDENTCRLDFKPSEAVSLGDTLEAVERAKAKERQREHGKTAPGRKKNTGGNLPEVIGDTRDAVGKGVGMSGKTYERAKAVAKAAKSNPAKYGKFAEAMDKTGKVAGAYKAMQRADAAETINSEPPPLPRGPFRVIVVDPPWPYTSRADDATHRAANPYPVESIEELKRKPIDELATKDAILWLWTTNAFMREAHELVEAWGFQAKSILTWVKDRMGTGDWLRGKTEHAVLAVRGKPIVTLSNQTTVIYGKLREHSRKPDEFYKLVESLCPGSRCELYGRQQRKGWTIHGSEIDKFQG
jgi:N6-adenosine-specific RNA methylase IME4